MLIMRKDLVRIGIFKKSKDLLTSEFRDYWHYHHGVIAVNMHGMQAYDQNHVIKNVSLGIGSFNDRICDGMSKIWFGNPENIAANDPETMHRLAIDEKYLFQEMDLVVCDEYAFKDPLFDRPYVKYMCLLRKEEGISAQEYSDELLSLGEDIMSIPGVIGYIQNTVLSRTHNDIQNEKRTEVGYDAVPVDVILEFYLEYSEKNIEGRFLQSPKLASLRESIASKTADATGYMCNVYRIL